MKFESTKNTHHKTPKRKEIEGKEKSVGAVDELRTLMVAHQP